MLRNSWPHTLSQALIHSMSGRPMTEFFYPQEGYQQELKSPHLVNELIMAAGPTEELTPFTHAVSKVLSVGKEVPHALENLLMEYVKEKMPKGHHGGSHHKEEPYKDYGHEIDRLLKEHYENEITKLLRGY